MVEVRSLSEYELWFAISSVMLSFAVGFFVAWLNADSASPRQSSSNLLSLVFWVFFVFTATAVGMTVVRRRRLEGHSTEVPFVAQRRPPE